MDKAPIWRRGDVGRRGLAFVIDLVLIMLLTQSLAALLFVPSRGTLIDSTSFILDCRTAASVPTGVTVPDGFERAVGRLCAKRHLGYPTAHFYALALQGPGSSTTTTVSYPLDDQWRPVSAFDLAALANATGRPVALVDGKTGPCQSGAPASLVARRAAARS